MFRFVRTYPHAIPADGPTILLRFHNGELLYSTDTFTPVPLEPDSTIKRAYLGTLDGIPCLVEGLPDHAVPPEGHRAVGVRTLYGNVEDVHYALVGYAAQIVRWQRTGKFCSVCATEMQDIPGSWGRECTNCGHNVYPPVSPAVLALVHDGGDRILLAQKEGWGKRYSILAGFVEPGESLEECAIREVHEEVGVIVENPLYQGSQPWPFPHQVMIGYTCQYVSGEIKLDELELSAADWFHVDALPELPPPLSLSRQIIDRWIASRQK